MSVLVLCPYVHRETFEGMWATLAPELRAGALVVHNEEHNLGAAGSRNEGARVALEYGFDWLVDVSPVTRFGPSGGRDFIDLLAEKDGYWIVQASAPVNWHLMAWHRTVFERVGFFDENFWPINGEDADFSYRVHTAAREDGRSAVWDCVDVDAWVTMYGHSQKVAGIVPDFELLWFYYRMKWGGLSGAEVYRRPFDDPEYGLDWCPHPPDSRSIFNEARGIER